MLLLVKYPVSLLFFPADYGALIGRYCTIGAGYFAGLLRIGLLRPYAGGLGAGQLPRFYALPDTSSVGTGAGRGSLGKRTSSSQET